jgi:hypothetical protein
MLLPCRCCPEARLCQSSSPPELLLFSVLALQLRLFASGAAASSKASRGVLDAALGWALVLAQFSSLVHVPSLLWVSVSPWAAVRRPSSQGEGAGVPLRPWKRMDRRRLAILLQP